MALGRLDTPITFTLLSKEKDEEGFSNMVFHPIACVREYKEDKNTTEKWANKALLEDVTTIFQIRYLPNTKITTDMQIECFDGTYDIKSVENIKGRNMYLQILAKKKV